MLKWQKICYQNNNIYYNNCAFSGVATENAKTKWPTNLTIINSGGSGKGSNAVDANLLNAAMAKQLGVGK